MKDIHPQLREEGVEVVGLDELRKLSYDEMYSTFCKFRSVFKARQQYLAFLIRHNLVDEFRRDFSNPDFDFLDCIFKYQYFYRGLIRIASIDLRIDVPKRSFKDIKSIEPKRNTKFDYEVLEARIQKLENDFDGLVSKLGDYFGKLEHLRVKETDE